MDGGGHDNDTDEHMGEPEDDAEQAGATPSGARAMGRTLQCSENLTGDSYGQAEGAEQGGETEEDIEDGTRRGSLIGRAGGEKDDGQSEGSGDEDEGDDESGGSESEAEERPKTRRQWKGREKEFAREYKLAVRSSSGDESSGDEHGQSERSEVEGEEGTQASGQGKDDPRDGMSGDEQSERSENENDNEAGAGAGEGPQPRRPWKGRPKDAVHVAVKDNDTDNESSEGAESEDDVRSVPFGARLHGLIIRVIAKRSSDFAKLSPMQRLQSGVCAFVCPEDGCDCGYTCLGNLKTHLENVHGFWVADGMTARAKAEMSRFLGHFMAYYVVSGSPEEILPRNSVPGTGRVKIAGGLEAEQCTFTWLCFDGWWTGPGVRGWASSGWMVLSEIKLFAIGSFAPPCTGVADTLVQPSCH
jgi:hypothetical protein